MAVQIGKHVLSEIQERPVGRGMMVYSARCSCGWRWDWRLTVAEARRDHDRHMERKAQLSSRAS